MRYVLGYEPSFDYANPTLIDEQELAVDVLPTPVPMLSDETILHEAEESGDWGTMEQYEYGMPEGEISVRALFNRFDTLHYRGTRRSDETMTAPEDFIEAVWESQRRIPNVSEYAQGLARTGLLTAAEATTAETVLELDDLSLVTRDEHEAELDEDERYAVIRTRAKLTYLINLQPGALPDDANIAKLADTYASKVANPTDKSRQHAQQMLWEARGLSDQEIKELTVTGQGYSGHDYRRYRLLGISPELSQQMADNPQTGLMHPADRVDTNMIDSLTGSLNTQLAVRQYLGTENLYEWLSLQRRTSRLLQSEHSSGKFAAQWAMTDAERARDRGDEAAADQIVDDFNARQAERTSTPLFELGMAPDETERYLALAQAIICEPALRGTVAYFVEWNMKARYRAELDAQGAATGGRL